MSTFNHGLEEYEDEDEDFYNHRRSNMRRFQYPEHADYSEDDENFLEDSEGSRQDGDEHKDPWITTDEEEDESQDLDMYEADCEDQDTDMDRGEYDQQNIELSGDQHESSLDTLHREGNRHSKTPTSPQISNPDPSPIPEPHHETIALGQHHLWMM